MFTGLPSWVKRIDAAYERTNDSTIMLFTGTILFLNRTLRMLLYVGCVANNLLLVLGKHYFEHDGSRILPQSPRLLTNLGLPEGTQIDAVFNWPKNRKTYFFRFVLFSPRIN